MDDRKDLKSLRLDRLWQVGLFYSFLAIILIPGPLDFLGWQKGVSDALILPMLKFVGGFIFPVENWFQEIASDSSFMWLLLALLVPCSLVLGFRLKQKDQVISLIQILLTYFLAFVLLNYGMDKVFKAQFYLPEPNILYTPFGMLDKDILYWSTMGISHEYNLFLGGAELIAACLILFRKTRVIGLVLAFGVLVNVVAVNFSFDISVKAFSLLLLLITLILLAPFARSFVKFLLFKQTVKLAELPRVPLSRLSSKVQFIAKVSIIGIVLTEAIFPYGQQGIYNDDLAERPILHGAYEVLDTSESNLRMIFIHRDGYLIFQDRNFRMKDYKLEINPIANAMNLTDYDGKENVLNYTYYGSTGKLSIRNRSDSFYIQCAVANWRELPALKPRLHMAID